MTKNYSPLSKIAYMAILVAVIAFMVKMAYGWSIQQTAVFTSAFTGGEFATEAAWLIQFSPQAAFVIAAGAMARRQTRLAYAAILIGLSMNAIDAFTNIVTLKELWPSYSAVLVAQGRSAEFINMTYPVGLLFAFAVTWFEEAIMLAAATILMLFVEVSDDVGLRLPGSFRRFMVSVSSGAKAAGGNIPGQRGHGNQSWPDRQNGKPSHGHYQPQRQQPPPGHLRQRPSPPVTRQPPQQGQRPFNGELDYEPIRPPGNGEDFYN